MCRPFVVATHHQLVLSQLDCLIRVTLEKGCSAQETGPCIRDKQGRHFQGAYHSGCVGEGPCDVAPSFDPHPFSYSLQLDSDGRSFNGSDEVVSAMGDADGGSRVPNYRRASALEWCMEGGNTGSDGGPDLISHEVADRIRGHRRIGGAHLVSCKWRTKGLGLRLGQSERKGADWTVVALVRRPFRRWAMAPSFLSRSARRSFLTLSTRPLICWLHHIRSSELKTRPLFILEVRLNQPGFRGGTTEGVLAGSNRRGRSGFLDAGKRQLSALARRDALDGAAGAVASHWEVV